MARGPASIRPPQFLRDTAPARLVSALAAELPLQFAPAVNTKLVSVRPLEENPRNRPPDEAGGIFPNKHLWDQAVVALTVLGAEQPNERFTCDALQGAQLLPHGFAVVDGSCRIQVLGLSASPPPPPPPVTPTAADVSPGQAAVLGAPRSTDDFVAAVVPCIVVAAALVVGAVALQAHVWLGAQRGDPARQAEARASRYTTHLLGQSAKAVGQPTQPAPERRGGSPDYVEPTELGEV